jgi:HEAT repeat protein
MPVRIDGGITMTGRMNFGDGDLSGMLFHGVPLAPIVGQHRANSTAMFFLVRNSDRIEQVHLGTFSLPGYFDNKPLVWLDSAGDAESVALISSIMRRAIDEDTQRDMVAALGVHGDAGVVVPPLIDLLQSRENEGVRREAAEWLGRKNDSRAITALSRVARADRSHDVRREAIEAFSHMRHAGATDSLIAFTSALDNHDLQRTAIEAIGDRADDRALSYLTRFARGRNDGDLRRQAVEALSNMDNGRGMNVVIDIARNDGDPDVRREAIESLAGIKPAARALEMLREIVRTDPDESVQSEAIETIAEVHDAASVAILADIVNHGTSERLQVEAVESLGETVAPARALPIVREISRKHPVERVREKALETLDNFKDKKR